MLKEEPGSVMEDTCTVHVKEEEEMEMESSEMKGKLKIDIFYYFIFKTTNFVGYFLENSFPFVRYVCSENV